MKNNSDVLIKRKRNNTYSITPLNETTKKIFSEKAAGYAGGFEIAGAELTKIMGWLVSHNLSFESKSPLRIKPLITKTEAARIKRLFPDREPRYVRCYDNGDKTQDRYTVVFTGRYAKKVQGIPVFDYLGMSDAPFHPQGVGMHGETNYIPVDRPTYKHLGKKIKFSDLPNDCKECAIQTYKSIWKIDEKIEIGFIFRNY